MINRFNVASVLAVLFSLGLSASSARAAQDGEVTAEAARILQQPNESATSVGDVVRGQRVRMSDTPRDGYYRVVVPGTRSIGWLNAGDVVPVGSGAAPMPPANPPEARDERSNRRTRDRYDNTGAPSPWYLEVFAHLENIPGLDASAAGSTTTTATSSIMTPAFGGELGYGFSPEWWAGLNIDHFSFKTTDGSGYNGKSNVVSVILNKELGRTGSWVFQAGAGLGMGVGTTVGAGVGTTSAMSASFSAPALTIRGSGKVYLSRSVALDLGLGYRYMSKSAVPLTTNVAIDANLSALFIGAGLQFHL